MMKNFTMKELWLLLCCLMAVSAIHAQNYSKKVKNAKGIEVTYQSSYKGKVRPGYLLMTVSTDRVSLENKRAESKQPNDNQVRPEDKTPVTGSYIDYTTCQSYRRAELPNGKIISAMTPFELGRGFTEKGEGKHLGLNCKIVRTMFMMVIIFDFITSIVQHCCNSQNFNIRTWQLVQNS